MSETVDKRTLRIKASAEQERLNRASEVEQKARAAEFALRQQHAELKLQQDREDAKRKRRQARTAARRDAREKLAARIGKWAPVIGRRAMICGPILAPMTVAWIGQISFAMDTLGWLFVGAVVFAAAWEMTTAFTGWMYHQARKDGDRGTLFRVATWVFAASAGAMNYWHACPIVTERLNVQTVRTYTNLDPTPKAVSYGAMSLVGIALWELYSSLIHRKELRAKGVVSAARPRFGILRWVRFPRITWTAWSLSVRYGIRTVDKAWAAAVAEVERKRRDRDHRPAVRVVVATTLVRTVVQPKTKVRLFWTDRAATTLTATVEPSTATTPRPVDATTPPLAIAATTTGGRDHAPPPPAESSVHPDATTGGDRPSDRTRPATKTTRKTGRVQVDATLKPQPSVQDNARAVALVKARAAEGRPLSKRALAKQFGFSPTWALKRIQEAGPLPVGGGRRDGDHVDASTPKDQPETSEAKTG